MLCSFLTPINHVKHSWSLFSRYSLGSFPLLFCFPGQSISMKIAWSALHLSCPNTGKTPPAKGFIDAEISCHTCFVLLHFLHVHKLLSIRNFQAVEFLEETVCRCFCLYFFTMYMSHFFG